MGRVAPAHDGGSTEKEPRNAHVRDLLDHHIAMSFSNTGTVEKSERLLRLRHVLDTIGVGKTTLYSMMKTGEFPPSRKVRRLSVWLESEVQGWIKAVAQSTTDDR
jgi:predicted DNA-binding transcriptional regulator AlpA